VNPVDPTLADVGWIYIVLSESDQIAGLISPDGIICTEWEPTSEEMQRLICGGRIRILAHTFHMPLQPLEVEVLEPEFPGAES